VLCFSSCFGLFYPVLSSAVLCRVMSCRFGVVFSLCCIVSSSSCFVLFFVALCFAVLSCFVLSCRVLCCLAVVLYCLVLCCLVLCCLVLCCLVLCCVALRCVIFCPSFLLHVCFYLVFRFGCTFIPFPPPSPLYDLGYLILTLTLILTLYLYLILTLTLNRRTRT
jgi:hypothetical protein